MKYYIFIFETGEKIKQNYKKMKKYFILFLAGIAFASCNQKTHSDQTTTTSEEEITAVDQGIENETLALNEGEKWEINTEMKPFLNNGESLVKEYKEKNLNNYSELGSALSDQNEKLISSCTMDGESHDELHKWLHPHLNLTKDLKEAEDAETADKIIDELKASYATFHKYFK